MKYRSFLFFTLSICLLFLEACTAPITSFSLQSPVDLVAGTPITIVLPSGIACCDNHKLQIEGSEEKLDLQALEEGNAIFLLNSKLPSGESRQYNLIQASDFKSEDQVKIIKNPDQLSIQVNNRHIFDYNTATLKPPGDAPAYYNRSGFIHPFRSPAGKILTDGFPIGHTHQHGIFFAWVNTTYRGDFTDFWNQQKETGTVALHQVGETTDGPVLAQIKTEHDFISTQHGPVVREEWTVNTYRHPRYNIIDIHSSQQMLGQDTLFINDYHYGGMGIRAAAEWNEVDTNRYTNPMEVITSEGLTRDSANHTRPNWTAAFGTIGDGKAGLALFNHPSNFRSPQAVRVHPTMPYFCLAPMVQGAFNLVPGQEYTSNYRIISYDGPPNIEELESMWQSYSADTDIEWIKH